MVKEDLEAKIFNLKERINSQKDIIDKNLKEIYSLKSRIENQQSEIFEFNVKWLRNNEENERLHYQLENEISKSMKIRDKLDEEKTINKTLTLKIDECGVNERSLNKEISSLQTELVQRASTIEMIKADKTAVSKEAKDLKEEVAKLKHEKTASTREIVK